MSGRDAEGPAFAFGRVSEARPDVVLGQLREVAEYLVIGHAAGEVPQHVSHGNPRPAHTGLPKPDGRIDTDAVEDAHRASLGQFDASVIRRSAYSVASGRPWQAS